MKQKLLLIVMLLAIPLGMLAQGTSWETATLIENGATVTGSLSADYNEAWYKIVVPEEGTVTVNIEAIDVPSNPDPLGFHYCNFYGNVDGHGLWNRGNFDGAFGAAATNMTATNIGKGTYYIQVRQGRGQGQFTLKYKFTPCPYSNDAEPNNDWQHAQQLTSGKTVQGRLGYCASNIAPNLPDAEDWYKITLAEEGSVKVVLSTGFGDLTFHYCYLYRVKNGEIISTNSFDGACGASSATLQPISLGKGTYYIHVRHVGGAGGYSIRYDFTPCPYSNDAEPNDDWQHAQQLTSGKTVQGRLGYRGAEANSNEYDAQDWYKITLPEEGSVKVVVTTGSGDLTYHYCYLYRFYDGDVRSAYTFDGAFNASSTTLQPTNLGKGTYYIHVRHAGGAGGYTIRYDFTPCPYADDGDNDSWDKAIEIQNGQTLQGRLGYRTSDNKTDEVDWYKIVVPNDGAVHMSAIGTQDLVFGRSTLFNFYSDNIQSRRSFDNSFSDSTSVTDLEMGPGTYYIQVIHSSGSGGYTLHYDFIENNYVNDTEPNNDIEHAMPVEYGSSFTGHMGYRNSENKTDGIDFFKVYLNGMSSFEFLIDPNSTLRVWKVCLLNDRGSGIGVGIDPRSGDTQFVAENLEPGYYYIEIDHNGGAGGYTVNCGKNTVYEGSNIKLTFEGKNSVRLGIPSEYTIRIENTSDVTSEAFFLPVMCTSDIELLGARLPGFNGYEEYLPMDSIGNEGDSIMVFIVPPMAPHETYAFNIIAQGLVMSQNHQNIDGKKDVIIMTGTALTFAGLLVLNTVVDYVGDEVIEFGTDLINERVDLTDEELDLYRHKNEHVMADIVYEKQQTGVGVKAAKRMAKTLITNLVDACGGKLINFAGEVIETCGALGKALYRRFDYWIQKDLGYFSEWEAAWKDKWHGSQRGVNKVVRSWDPNEMVGPEGVGDKHYIGDTRTMDYRILFENKKEATAPAYRIRITDVLDENVFDVNSVRFGGSSHEGPGYNWKMNRNGNTLSWDIEGIELPPNINAPEGEGYVTFTVNLKPGLANETQIKNKATIIFDYNAPIETNEHFNTLDLVAPTSSMVSATMNGDKVNIKCRGIDRESGVGQYYYYSVVNDGEGEYIGCGVESEFDYEMPLGANVADYKFYALAIDEVGNIQETKPNPIGVSSGLKGDVNGDGEVNISDVNAIINMILGGGTNPAADVNNDGEINIADVNAVIDIILK